MSFSAVTAAVTGSPLDAPPPAGEVWTWAIPCSDPPAAPPVLEALLSRGERERVARFRFEADRLRAVIGRGLARVLLGGCLGRAPERLDLVEGAYGKPALGRSEAGAVDFNISHSGDWVVVGLAAGAEVGVDVEQHRPLTDLDALVERFFAPGEGLAIRALPPEQRADAFFRCWTRKEAYIKAVGAGMQIALAGFEVEARPGRPPALLSLAGSTAAASAWRLWSGTPAAGYSAALATRAPGPVRAWYWSGRQGLSPWPRRAPSATGAGG